MQHAPRVSERAYGIRALCALHVDAGIQGKRLVKRRTHVHRSVSEVTLSKIFSWYAKDFVDARGSVISFLLPFMPEADRAWITQHKQSLSLAYFEYDWDTNGVPPCDC